MIDKLASITEPINVPTLEGLLSSMARQAVGILYSKTAPTTVPEGKIVIMDDGAGTKRVYFRTGLGNVGYVALT